MLLFSGALRILISASPNGPYLESRSSGVVGDQTGNQTVIFAPQEARHPQRGNHFLVSELTGPPPPPPATVKYHPMCPQSPQTAFIFVSLSANLFRHIWGGKLNSDVFPESCTFLYIVL